MSYEYKTILRRENHDFDYFKNKWNSKMSGIIAIPKDGKSEIYVADINNKTGEVIITDIATDKFKKQTIDLLKLKIN